MIPINHMRTPGNGFRHCVAIGVDLDVDAGEAVAFDGSQGSFGVGGHYLRFRDGPYWIKGGTDSPENFLGYGGFENTRGKHRDTSHIEEWHEGDPDWDNGKGHGIITEGDRYFPKFQVLTPYTCLNPRSQVS